MSVGKALAGTDWLSQLASNLERAMNVQYGRWFREASRSGSWESANIGKANPIDCLSPQGRHTIIRT